jgi:hypothetical protein
MTTATATVTDRSALASALRDLKLSGMLATLDARLAQARAGELGHLDFLQVLCQDEISRRQSMSLARQIRRARFETEATLEGFDFTASPKLPAAQIRDLAALRWLQSGESVILYGPVGVGKSHIAQALAHLAVRAGAEARLMKTSRVLASLAGGRADRTWDKRLAEFTCPVSMTASLRLPPALVWQEPDVAHLARSTPPRPSQPAGAEAASGKGPSPRKVISDAGQKKATRPRRPSPARRMPIIKGAASRLGSTFPE